jgi:hypothetical protein
MRVRVCDAANFSVLCCENGEAPDAEQLTTATPAVTESSSEDIV